jgi:hypothetical protein
MSKRTKRIEILRWDAVIPSSSNVPSPTLYIAPDEDFLQMMEENENWFPVKITGTNSFYDNRLVMSSCQLSEFTGGYRPNFQACTGLITVTLSLPWEGYPTQNGYVEFLTVDSTDVVSPDNLEFFTHSSPPPLGVMVMVMLMVMVMVVLWIFKQKKMRI